MDWSQEVLVSTAFAERDEGRMEVTSDGDREFVLVEAGESRSASDDSRLLADEGYEREVPSRTLGRSLPVGPFPSDGRLAGGRLSAARSVVFSSSNSVTRCSNA